MIENSYMSTIDAKTDLEAVFIAVAEKRRVDPEVARRIREKSAASRKKFDREVSLETLRSSRDDD
jgi:hypothetical protein